MKRRERLGVERLLGIELGGAVAVGGRQQPPRQAAQRRAGIAAVGARGGDLLQLVGLPFEELASLGGGAQPPAADLGLHPVGDLRGVQQAGSAQQVEQVRRPGGVGRQRAPGRPQHGTPQGGVCEGGLHPAGERDPVLREHPGNERRRPLAGAVHDHDLRGGHTGALQLEHLRGHQLGLGALSPGLQQRDHGISRVGLDPLGAGLEQRALEVVQHPSRAGRVVLVLGGQLAHVLGERPQFLHRLRAGDQRLVARLVGERDGDGDADDPRERLDRVTLQRGQVVEAVEEHRVAPPPCGRRPQRVERPPGVELPIDPAQPVELAHVAGVDLAHVPGERRPAHVLRRPGPQCGRQPLRGDQLALELGDQLAGRLGKAGRARRGAQRVEAQLGEHPLQQPFALQRRHPPARIVGPPRDLRRQTAERQHRPLHHPLAGQLQRVMARILRRRHHQHRPTPRRRPIGAQHLPGLGRVGGSRYESQGHAPMLPLAPDVFVAPGDDEDSQEGT